MVQLQRDVLKFFIGDQSSWQRWLTLGLWQRLCHVLLIRESPIIPPI